MDILKRKAAPITVEAWDEIDKTAKAVLINMLSARKVLKLNGPRGWEFNSVDEGRLEELDKTEKLGEVRAGIFKIKRLIEPRISFQLSKWELDNISRGVKDPDLTELEKAVEKLALFEEAALFNGYKKGEIEGLIPSAGHKVKLPKDGAGIIKTITELRYTLFNSYVSGPFDMVVSKDIYDSLNIIYEGVALIKILKDILGGDILRSANIDGGIILPHKNEDLEFTVGQDFAIGYERDLGDNVQLFATETFTFRVLNPDILVSISL